MKRALFSLCIVLSAAPFVAAHPIPQNNRDRTIVVHLTPTAVIVDYRLELDEQKAYDELPIAVKLRFKDRSEIPAVFLPYFAPVVAGNLVATIDEKPLVFTPVSKYYWDRILDHQRYDYRFEAKWNPAPGVEHTFTLRKATFTMMISASWY